MDVGQLVLNGGAAGAVIAVVLLFLKHMKEERADRASERTLHEDTVKSIVAESKASSEAFAKALSKNTEVMQEICLRIEHCPAREEIRSGKNQGGT
jgi:hypothetical protein